MPLSLRPMVHADNGLQDYIATSRYARYDPVLRRRETWAEAVSRVREMHLTHYANRPLAEVARARVAAGEVSPEILALLGEVAVGSLHEGIREAFASVEAKEVLPSMRSLQFGGEAILSKHTRIYNCAFTHIDRLEAFRETFYLLLCGCGVGFSVQRHHVARLPRLAPLPAPGAREVYCVADTVEGWGTPWTPCCGPRWKDAG